MLQVVKPEGSRLIFLHFSYDKGGHSICGTAVTAASFSISPSFTREIDEIIFRSIISVLWIFVNIAPFPPLSDIVTMRWALEFPFPPLLSKHSQQA